MNEQINKWRNAFTCFTSQERIGYAVVINNNHVSVTSNQHKVLFLAHVGVIPLNMVFLTALSLTEKLPQQREARHGKAWITTVSWSFCLQATTYFQTHFIGQNKSKATSQFKLILCNHHAGMGENKISILGIVCEYFKWKIGYIICATDGSLVVFAHKTELKILKLDLGLAGKMACVIWSQYRRVAAYMLCIGNLCHICIAIINNWRTVMWMRDWTKVTVELSS